MGSEERRRARKYGFAVLGVAAIAVGAVVSILLSSGLDSADAVASITGAVAAVVGFLTSTLHLRSEQRRHESDTNDDS